VVVQAVGRVGGWRHEAVGGAGASVSRRQVGRTGGGGCGRRGQLSGQCW
jgi:hypothetical protein